MSWDVRLTNKAQKGSQKLSKRIQETFQLLLNEMEICGPIMREWPNYGKIEGSQDYYHCHLKKGNPTYVAIWKVTNKKEKIIEVTYVGTHEKANYNRLR